MPRCDLCSCFCHTKDYFQDLRFGNGSSPEDETSDFLMDEEEDELIAACRRLQKLSLHGNHPRKEFRVTPSAHFSRPLKLNNMFQVSREAPTRTSWRTLRRGRGCAEDASDTIRIEEGEASATEMEETSSVVNKPFLDDHDDDEVLPEQRRK